MRTHTLRFSMIAMAIGITALCAALTTNILGANASAGQTAAKRGKGFSPKTLAGTYSGTWTNTTFGSTGPVTLKFTSKKGKLGITLDFGGDVFGCADPAADTVSLKAGNRTNRWNGKGFKVLRDSPSLGNGSLVYVYKTKVLTGDGVDPDCKPGLKWELSETKLTKTTLSGTVKITLPDGSAALATLSATK